MILEISVHEVPFASSSRISNRYQHNSYGRMYQQQTSVTVVSLQLHDLGCYTDDPDNRTLKEEMWREQPGMTHEWCGVNCTKLNFPYYGLEYGRECKITFPAPLFNEAHF